MKTMFTFRALCVSAALACWLSAEAQPQLITSGDFEAGFSGWTRVDQIGSDGTFFAQSGAASPVNGFPVPAPPEGVQAAMTDATAGGSHVLYQDFTVPVSLLSGMISLSLFLSNGDTAFRNPASLDWAATNNPGTPNLNQQGRVDLVRTSADSFSVAAGDVLQNLLQTLPADPLLSGYNTFSTDISAPLAANQGQTLRLRFAELDNVSFLNLGVDQVSVEAPVSEPAPISLMMAVALLFLAQLCAIEIRRFGVSGKPVAPAEVFQWPRAARRDSWQRPVPFRERLIQWPEAGSVPGSLFGLELSKRKFGWARTDFVDFAGQ